MTIINMLSFFGLNKYFVSFKLLNIIDNNYVALLHICKGKNKLKFKTIKLKNNKFNKEIDRDLLHDWFIDQYRIYYPN